MRNRILYIWDSDYPWDVRVEKICTSLVRHGYEVHIAARNLKGQSEHEVIDRIHIHRLKHYPNKNLNYVLSFPAFFSPIWTRFLDHIIATQRIDLLIVRDLPLAITAIRSGRRHEVPVILDMAEDYLAMIRDIWRARKFQGLNLVVRNPYLVKLVERYVFRHIDHVLVVIEEAMHIANRYNMPKSRMTLVGNTPVGSKPPIGRTTYERQLGGIAERSSIIYTGGIQMGRGIQTVLEALPEVAREFPDVLFVIVGNGYATEQLKRLAKERGVERHVLWVGWLDHSDMYAYIAACKAGIIPHFVTDHVDTTIPNKLFDYMNCMLPVIASNAKPMQRIITEEECGLTFESGNSGDLARRIKEVLHDPRRYGLNGARAVKRKYNWGEDEKRLREVIGSFCRRSTPHGLLPKAMC